MYEILSLIWLLISPEILEDVVEQLETYIDGPLLPVSNAVVEMIFELFSKEYLARDLKRANLITSGIGDRT
jgi:hypothetical protein